MNLFKTLAMVGLLGVGLVVNGVCSEVKSSSSTNINQDHQLPPELRSVRLTFSVDQVSLVELFYQFQRSLRACYPASRLKVALSVHLAEMLIEDSVHEQKHKVTLLIEDSPVKDVIKMISATCNLTWRVTGDTLIFEPLTQP